MIAKTLFTASVCLVLTLGAARAQNPGASAQADSAWRLRQIQSTLPGNSNTVPEFYEGENSDVGPQSVLQFRSHRHLFEASADEQFFYTDNVLLADHGKKSSGVLISTIQAALAPTPYVVGSGLLSPRIGYQQQWFNYGLTDSGKVLVFPSLKSVNMDVFDFNAGTAFTDIEWRWKNWSFTVGGDYRRLLDSGDYKEFYHEFVPRWGVRRDFQVCNSLAVSVGYEGDYRFTRAEPPGVVTNTSPVYPDSFNDRTDHSLVIVANWQLCSHAILQPFYRLQYSHYTQIAREDWLNSFGLTLHCPITKNISLRAFVGYDILNTDGFYVQDYQKLDAGGGVNLTVRF